MSATVWSNYAAGLINWPRVEKLIWQKGLCRSTVFLSDLRTSKNLIELQLDNSTIGPPDSYKEDQWYLDYDAYSFAIFQNLNDCNQLTIFSCANCWLQWKSDEDMVLDKFVLPGQMCSQWLLRSAPLSLRFYIDPIYAREIEVVQERYRVRNELLDGFSVLLDPQPLDHIDSLYVNVEYV